MGLWEWLVQRQTLCLYSFWLSSPVARVEPRGPLDIRFIAGMADRTTALLRAFYPAGGVEERLDKGDRCCVGVREDRVAGYCWLGRGEVSVAEIHRSILVAPDEVYYYDAYTVPECRGQNIFPALLARMLEADRAQGLARALIFAMSTNHPSRRAISKAGFQHFRDVEMITVLGLSFYRMRPLRSEREVAFV
ncbi:MAG: GNAT family N-acetyltransferase [Deltaproteobacteria bacterium]|nr:GNAT family N-acetyltransferase [Deltaproteobacteria bacterium]MBI3076422.1 GNAT family N-acetyltransferase [Deltaproteobacteria bacterium]